MTVFYTAPTAIRAFMKAGRELPDESDLSSLSLLGTVGEPINPEAWRWYHEVIGDEKCPIVDTWWQTETGGHMLSAAARCNADEAGQRDLPVFGIDAAVVDREGNEVPTGETGLLVIRKPWPSMLRGILGRSGAVPEDVLERRARHVLQRRRGKTRRRRLLRDHRPNGRRPERQRPPPRHGRGRERAGAPRSRRRGGGRGHQARGQGRSRRGLRHSPHRLRSRATI